MSAHRHGHDFPGERHCAHELSTGDSFQGSAHRTAEHVSGLRVGDALFVMGSQIMEQNACCPWTTVGVVIGEYHASYTLKIHLKISEKSRRIVAVTNLCFKYFGFECA